MRLYSTELPRRRVVVDGSLAFMGWLGNAGIAVVIALLKRFAAPPPSKSAIWRLAKAQEAERLPPGVIGGCIFATGLLIGSTYFWLLWANHRWASQDQEILIQLFPSTALWWFFPLFGAICIPWPLAIWTLRRLGRIDEADSMAELSSHDSGFDTYRVLTWFSFGIALPLALISVLLLPRHLSLTKSEARLGHFGSLQEEVFPFNQATKATLTTTYTTCQKQPCRVVDLVIDFRDGRKLRANEMGDGGTSAKPEVIRLLMESTHLTQVTETTSHF